MKRPRRQPTPGFKVLPPYDPITGERGRLAPVRAHPYAALFQIAAEDTHEDYVVCRGYDPRDGKFYDYDGADALGISVAKPYGNRTTGLYQVGQIFLALLPLGPILTDTEFGPLGQNPGTAESGQPADLDETVSQLEDDNGIGINWMLVDSSGFPWYWGKLDGDLEASGSATVSIYIGGVDTGLNVTAYSPPTQSGTVSSTSDVRIEWSPAEQKWYVTMAPCE